MPTVYVGRESYYQEVRIREILRRGLKECGVWENLSGLKVLVKPNLTSPSPPDMARTTHPVVVKALCDLLEESGVKNYSIGESSAVGFSTRDAWEKAGFGSLGNGYNLIDFKGREEIRVLVEGGLFKEIFFFCEAFQYDLLISVAKLKTIFACEVSLTCKNMKGLLPDHEKKRFHRQGIHQGVADLLSILPPAIGIIDGIWGLSLQEKRESGVILVGDNLLGTDAVGAKIMGIEPSKVEHLKKANEMGLGTISIEEIDIRGSDLRELSIEPFQTAAGVGDLKDVYGIKVHAGTTCSGCVGMLKMALRELADSAGVNPDLSIALGTGLDQEEVSRETVVIGNCAAILQDYPGFVPGCPPEKANILKAIKMMQDGKS